MAIEKHPYELLVRFDEKTGAFQGAHVRYATTVVDDATKTRAAPLLGDAEPIKEARLRAILGEATAKLIDRAEKSEAAALRDSKRADQIEASTAAELATLRAAVASVRATLASVKLAAE